MSGEALRLAYPEAEAAGGARSAPSAAAVQTSVWRYSIRVTGSRPVCRLGTRLPGRLHDSGKQGVSEWHTRGSRVRDCTGRLFGARWGACGARPSAVELE